MKNFDATKIAILVIVLVALGVVAYFGYKALFGGEKVKFDFNPLKNFQAVAYQPVDFGEAGNKDA